MPETYLPEDIAGTIEALVDAAGGCGAWSAIADHMRENFDIEDPDGAVEALREWVEGVR